MKRYTTLIIVVLTLLMAVPAYAGSYKLKYESKGQVSLALRERPFGPPVLSIQILPLTGDHSPGAALIRLDGQPIYLTIGDSYRSEVAIPEDGYIPVLDNDELKKIGQSQPNSSPIKVDSDWFLHEHQIEVFFYALDSRGKPSKNHSAAPATQFRIQREEPITAALTDGGAPLTSNQLDAAIRQSYEKGVGDAQATEAQNREELLRQLQKMTEEKNELQRKLALGTSSGTVTVSHYLPFRWTEPGIPKVGDEMILTLNGNQVAGVKVVEVCQGGRVWVYAAAMSSNIDMTKLRLAHKARTEKN